MPEHSHFRLPIYLRPLHRENATSYGARLAAANRMECLFAANVATEAPIVELIATIGGFSPERWAPETRRGQRCPGFVAPTRHGCSRCSSGAAFEQYPHAMENICLKHRRWHGPGTDGSTQFTIRLTAPVRAAERRHRHLMSTGRSTPYIYERAWNLVRDAAFLKESEVLGEGDAIDTTQRVWWETVRRFDLFPETVQVESMLVEATILSKLLHPAMPAEEVRDHVRSLLPMRVRTEVAVERFCFELEPLRRRAQRFRNAEWWLPRYEREPDLSRVETYDWEDAVGRSETLRGFVVVKTFYKGLPGSDPSAMTLWDWDANGPRSPWFDWTRTPAVWVCDNGHDWSALPYRISRGHRCPVCTGVEVRCGVNDLGCLYGDLVAQYWDFEKNTKSPHEITPGSKYKAYWICEKGHSWRNEVKRVVNGSRCGVCSGHTVQPGITDISTTHPEHAKSYSSSNPIPATAVSQGSNRKVLWECECGHTWTATVGRQLRKPPGCAGHAKNHNAAASAAPN